MSQYRLHEFLPGELIRAADANEMDEQIKRNADDMYECTETTNRITVYGLFIKDGILYEGLPEEEDLEADG